MGKQKRHLISLDGFDTYTFEHRAAGSFDEGEHKTLDVVVVAGVAAEGASVQFVVRDHGVEKHRGDNLRAAVEAYNVL